MPRVVGAWQQNSTGDELTVSPKHVIDLPVPFCESKVEVHRRRNRSQDSRCRAGCLPILMNDAQPAIDCDFRAWALVLGMFRAPEANVDAGDII
jgi:hypothetical protein